MTTERWNVFYFLLQYGTHNAGFYPACRKQRIAAWKKARKFGITPDEIRDYKNSQTKRTQMFLKTRLKEKWG